MNITSYNITDVGFHYIGIRVLAAASEVSRDDQFKLIASNVLKYVNDRALRLMLPEPRGSFETIGEKVCQELAKLTIAKPESGKGYKLSDFGILMLALLNSKDFAKLRRAMADAQLITFDNLREVVLGHVEGGPIFSPIVESSKSHNRDYICRLLSPTFGEQSHEICDSILSEMREKSAKQIENVLRERILSHMFPGVRLSVPLFRSMCDRLVSLRLLNIMKASAGDGEFAKSYSPCVTKGPPFKWFKKLTVHGDPDRPFVLFMSEPDVNDVDTRGQFMIAFDKCFETLESQAGYYDLPEVRDFVCERLLFPEAAFDEGVNVLLDMEPSPLTVGLQYERISGRRKPLLRSRESTQIYNLIRRA